MSAHQSSAPAVPSIVHFCFGMTPDFGGRPFSLVHYLSVRSAFEVLKPDSMILHCAHEPEGDWWELAKPMLQVHRVTPVAGIYGFPAAHPAHRADIVRLAALQAMGGIYLDTDVLVVRPFDSLMNAEFAAAREVMSNGVHVGLSNAILVSRSDSRFGRLCLEGHDPRTSLWQGFRSKGRDQHYVEFSVRYPCMLADLAPGLLTALPSHRFLWATWEPEDLAKLFQSDVPVPEEVLAIHLWESHAWQDHLSQLTPDRIRAEDTTFNRLARRFLPSEGRGEALGGGGAVCEEALKKMDAICREADFVHDRHLPPTNILRRSKRLFLRAARRLRDGVTSPLWRRIDELNQRVETQLSWEEPPPPVVGVEAEPGEVVPRFGHLDGSAELLAGHFPPGSGRFVLITGNGSDPSVASWLVRRRGSYGVWAAPSLARAKQLSEWADGVGLPLRAILAPAVGEALAEPLLRLFRGTGVLVLADVPNHLERWRGWAGDPQVVMICGRNDVAGSDGIEALATEKGYHLADSSFDGTFRVFTRGPSTSPAVRPPRDQKIRTLYGQAIHVPANGDAS